MIDMAPPVAPGGQVAVPSRAEKLVPICIASDIDSAPAAV